LTNIETKLIDLPLPSRRFIWSNDCM